jgi:chemotaxis protein methyltransferase CheR
MKNDYQYFVDKVKEKIGIDLSLYKEQQMKRRLTSLSNKYGFSTLQSFYHGMETDEELFESFLSYMTINVSEFFRNRKQWNILENKILPSIIQKQNKMKVWSAACSTGEEPYSLGILLSKYMEDSDFSVLATDLDQSILNQAKKGLYIKKSVKELTEDEIATYFDKDGHQYKISNELKKMITFKKHDLLVDRFQNNFDLIVCRNVLIYFTEEAKSQIIHKFSQSLKKGGILFLGTTERILNPMQYRLEPVSSFFFRKI